VSGGAARYASIIGTGIRMPALPPRALLLALLSQGDVVTRWDERPFARFPATAE